MRKLLAIIVLSLCFITPSQADDIRDFQIEGISLGDSSLDHFSEKEIKKFTQKFKYYNNDFVPVSPKIKPEAFDELQFYYKNNDSKKPIHVISGVINFENNIEACYKKKKSLIEELKLIFPDIKQVDKGVMKHDFDKTGKSTKSNYRFVFDNGDYAVVACYDWSKKMKKFKDHLRVAVVKKDFDYWIYNVATK